MSRLGAAALTSAFAAFSLAIAAWGSGPALASPPAKVQYEVGEPTGGTAGDRPSTSVEPDPETPAGAAVDSLADGHLPWLLAAIAAITLVVGALAIRQGRLRRPRIVLASVIGFLIASTAVLVSLPAAETGRPLPRLFWGLVPQAPHPESDYRQIGRAGVDSLRIGVEWSSIEVGPGFYDWASTDHVVAAAARGALEVLPVLSGTPSALATDPRTLPVRTGAQREAWSRFLRQLAARYGPRGSFWRGHGPGSADPVPYRPIRNWQIWNEPNFFYFARPPSPQLYGRLVQISHRALVAIDPGARVILAGLFATPRQGPPQAFPATDFLDRLYRVEGIRSSFDGVALHPYSRDAGDMESSIAALRAVMARNRDRDTGLWLTEVGWGSGRGTAFEKGPRGQVDELTEAFELLIESRAAWRIERVYWFSWEDVPGACNFCDSTGLFTHAGREKPAWERYRQFALDER